jgi:hypothetical protein
MGTWSNTTGNVGQMQCINCEAGTYSSTVGATSISTCQPCPIGTSSQQPALDNINKCAKCDPGTYGPTVGATRCQKCDPGTFSHTQAATNCTSCPTGTTSAQGSTDISDCQTCPVGKYIANITGPSECSPCPVGTFAPEKQPGVCLSCPRGTYSSNVGVVGACTPCPAGTYSSTIRATSNSTCTLCSNTQYAPLSGSSDCMPCPYRTFRSDDGTACIACDAGYYLDVNNIQCKSCSNESYCPVGSISPTLYALSFLSDAPVTTTALYDDQRTKELSTVQSIMNDAIAAGIIACWVVICVAILAPFSVILLVSGKSFAFRRFDWFFSENHPRDEEEPPLKRSTSFGGFLSIAALFAMAAIASAIIFKFFVGNTIFTESLVQVDIYIPLGTYIASGTFYTGHNSCNATSSFNGFTGKPVVTTEMPKQGICTVTWTCKKCKMTGANMWIKLNVTDSGVSAVAMNYTVSVPYFSNTQYTLQSTNLYADSGAVLRGNSASVFTIQISAVQLITFSNPILTGYSTNTDYGLRSQHITGAAGSQVGAYTYNIEGDTGVSMYFAFSLNPSTAQIQEVQITNFSSMLSQISSLTALCLTVFRSIFEKIIEWYAKYQEKKKKKLNAVTAAVTEVDEQLHPHQEEEMHYTVTPTTEL